MFPNNKQYREAFILLSNADEIETALQMDCKKFGETFIEIYRSSLDQMEFYCRILSETPQCVTLPPTSVRSENDTLIRLENKSELRAIQRIAQPKTNGDVEMGIMNIWE